MKQSKLMSLVESAVNILVGVVVAMTLNAIVLPRLGFDISLQQNAIFAAIMTVVSIVRSFGMRRLFEALHIRHPISPFMAAVIAERRRQIEQEGWSTEHDDDHVRGELAQAGATYAYHAFETPFEREEEYTRALIRVEWPWDFDWYKPTIPRRDLVKGAALVVAEGEKFDRSKTKRLQPSVPHKHGHNDLSEWKQFGGTLERPAAPAPMRAPKAGSGVK